MKLVEDWRRARLERARLQEAMESSKLLLMSDSELKWYRYEQSEEYKRQRFEERVENVKSVLSFLVKGGISVVGAWALTSFLTHSLPIQALPIGIQPSAAYFIEMPWSVLFSFSLLGNLLVAFRLAHLFNHDAFY